MRDKCIDTIEMNAASAPTSWGNWAHSGARMLAADAKQLVNLVMVWMERDRMRRALKEMEAHTIRDIGLDRAELHREIQKPFWMA